MQKFQSYFALLLTKKKHKKYKKGENELCYSFQ